MSAHRSECRPRYDTSDSRAGLGWPGYSTGHDVLADNAAVLHTSCVYVDRVLRQPCEASSAPVTSSTLVIAVPCLGRARPCTTILCVSCQSSPWAKVPTQTQHVWSGHTGSACAQYQTMSCPDQSNSDAVWVDINTLTA